MVYYAIVTIEEQYSSCSEGLQGTEEPTTYEFPEP